MTDDYAVLYAALQGHNLEFQSLLSLMLLVLMRLFPIIALTPFLGGKILPHPVKVGFGIALFVVFLPKLAVVTTTELHFSTNLLGLALKELVIGWVIGIFSSIPFHIVEIAGMFTDHQRGGASLLIQDPTIQTQTSPLGTVYNLVLIYLFYVVSGPFHFIEAIFNSYDVIPPDVHFSRLFFQPDVPFWEEVIKVFGHAMITGIRIASPALIVILMTDFFLGIINRMAPQVMITFLGLPLKSLLGLAVIALGWKLLLGETVKEAQRWMLHIGQVVRMMGIGQ